MELVLSDEESEDDEDKKVNYPHGKAINAIWNLEILLWAPAAMKKIRNLLFVFGIRNNNRIIMK